MSRLSLVDLNQTSEAVRELTKNMPPLHIFKTMAHAEGAFVPLLQLTTALSRDGKLSPKHRELTILHAANQDGGEYEWVQHVPTSAEAGTSEEQREALRKRDYSPELWDEAERALLRYLQQVVQQSKVDADTWGALRAQFSEREVVELTLIHGMYRTLAVLTENAETPIDQPSSTAVFDAMKNA